jgi:PKD repeat protein
LKIGTNLTIKIKIKKVIKIKLINKNKIKIIQTSKSQRISQILALILIAVVLIADFTKLGLAIDLQVDLDANPTTADVGENIVFNWTIIGDFDSGWINFGDGNVTSLAYEDANSSISHKYAIEGKYNVTLYATTNGIDPEEATDSLVINIKNNAPQFNISLSSSAYEDDNVTISVIDIEDSDHDEQSGILTYIYDFADGTSQESTNQSSTTHVWTNAGNYRVTVTVIDDQNAATQKSEYIEIQNKDPDADFTITSNVQSQYILESYYGSFDFQSDLIDDEPDDWDVTDSGDPDDVYTAIVRPNADVSTEWNGDTPHWSRLDEVTPDGVKIYTNADAKSDEWDFTTFTLPSDYIVTKLSVKARGYYEGETPPGALVQYRIGTGGYSSSKESVFSTTWVWDTMTWSGLSLTQSEINDLRVRFLSDMPPFGEGSIHVDTVYVELTYEPATIISIVDVEGYTNEVVRLLDRSSSLQAYLENSFANQQYGTVEFWVKSNDASVFTWAISLWDGTSMAFSIAMDDDKWKYSNGSGYNEMSEVGTPTDNEWYWLRIDFCASGTYLNLSAQQFKVNVNGTWSNTYSFGSITQLNKVRIESGTSDTGTAWIDAIGYSWDPDYDIGDNKVYCLWYPEKCNIHFAGGLSTDTVSDLNLLRYYWQFGDGTSGFGKYIIHEFKQSGIYNVTLTVKDDNGAIDAIMKRVLVHNKYPDINITVESGVTLNEGETMVVYVDSSDEITDLALLEYYWNFNSSDFNPFNVSGYEAEGWRNSHIFSDDFNGEMGVMVRDPEGKYNIDEVCITILNVNPSISLTDVNIIANIT